MTLTYQSKYIVIANRNGEVVERCL